MSVGDILDWHRGWVPPDGRLPLDEDAWLPERDVLELLTSDVVEFEDVEGIPCLLLVGEPGTGKSCALRQAAQRAETNKAPTDELLWYDLGVASNVRDIKDELFGAPAVRRFATSRGRLHLFLDSLDEAKVQVRRVVSLLEEQLGILDLDRLILRIACRTADLPQAFQQWLAERYGETRMRTLELAPLRRSDAAAAAAAVGLDADAFLAQVRSSGVEAFAARPLALKLLIRVVRAEGRLPAQLSELYKDALRLMAGEQDEERPPPGLSDTQALAIASRIAAATVLAGRDAVDHRGLGVAGAVSLDALAGGLETDRMIATPTDVDVNVTAVQEVLGSGLFSARGPALGWAHRTFGDFLAAYWLASDQRTEKQIGDLLLVDDGRTRRIAPELRNVAGWLLALRPGFAAQLESADAIVLAYGDPASVPAERRRTLLRSVLDAIGDQALDRYVVRRWWVRMRYPDISEDLRAVITNTAYPDIQREAAADAVAELKLSGMSDLLVDVALASDETVDLRASMVRAVRDLVSDEQAARLRPLALEPQIADVDDELKGAALRVCWPRVIAAEELFAGLTPEKNEALLGIYVIFLRRECAPHLTTPEDLHAGVPWAAALPREWYSTRDVAFLADVIVAKAWPLAATNSALAEELATLVARTSHERMPLLMTAPSLRHDEVPDSALEDDDGRRAVVTVLVARVAQGETPIEHVLPGLLSLVRARDMTWMLGRMSAAPGGQADVWRQLCIEMLRRGLGADELYEVREQHEDLFELVAWRYGAVVLDSPEAEAERRAWEEQQRSWGPLDEDPGVTEDDLDAMVVDHLARFQAGEFDAFWLLQRPLLATERGMVMSEGFADDLSQTPGWRRAPHGIRSEIVDAAAEYLDRAGAEPSRWLGQSRMFRPAWAGYRALRLLWSQRPEAFEQLSDEVWRRWAAIVIGWPPRNRLELDEFEQAALREVRRVVPEDARRFGLTWLDEHLSEAALAELRIRLAELWDSRLEDELLGFLDRPELSPGRATAIVAALVDRDAARRWARERLTPEALNDPQRRGLALDLVEALAAGPVEDVWDLIMTTAAVDEDAARLVVVRLAAARGSALAGRLTPQRLGDLFRLLNELFPPGDAGTQARTFQVTPEMEVSMWKSALLDELTQHGTTDSVAVLRALEQELDDAWWIRRLRHQAEEQLRRMAWTPPEPAEIVRLGESRARRYVADASSMRAIIVDALDEIARDMRGAFPLANQVWNTAPHQIPKRENEISSVLAYWLRTKLGGRQAVVNREVEINAPPGGAAGDRTDILVQASGAGNDVLSIVIEVKGAWNAEIMDAMETQLADQYLKPDLTSHGIYLVAWFSDERWDGFDANQRDRRRRATRVSAEQLRQLLTDQAQRLSNATGLDVIAYVLDCSL